MMAYIRTLFFQLIKKCAKRFVMQSLVPSKKRKAILSFRMVKLKNQNKKGEKIMFNNIKNNFKAMFVSVRSAVANNKAEGFVDSGVKILIAVVIGALLLGGLYTLFGDTILPGLTSKIGDLFNYAG